MKVLAWTDIASTSGFAKQMNVILPQLHEQFDLHLRVAGINYRGWEHPFTFQILPIEDMDGGRSHAGIHQVIEVIDTWKPDVFFCLTSLEVFQLLHPRVKDHMKYLHLMKEAKEVLGFQWIGYFPVEMAHLDEDWLAVVDAMDTPICYNPWAQQVLADHGRPGIPHLPHGIHTDVYDVDADPDRLKYDLGVPEDAYLITSVFRNYVRKDPTRMLRIFKRVQEARPHAYLWLHCDPLTYSMLGFDLDKWIDYLDVPSDRVQFAPRFKEIWHAWPEQFLANLYHATDLYLSTSLAEGWGLPVTEAMASNTLTMAPEFSATGWQMGTFDGAEPRGIPLPAAPESEWFDVPIINAVWNLPRVDEDAAVELIVDAMDNPHKYEAARQRGHEWSQGYDFANIWPEWEAFFSSVLDGDA